MKLGITEIDEQTCMAIRLMTQMYKLHLCTVKALKAMRVYNIHYLNHSGDEFGDGMSMIACQMGREAGV